MPISTTCPSCKALFRLPEELAGKKVKCQKCQNLFVVPAVEAGAVAPGAQVPDGEERSNPAAEGPPSRARTAPTRPEDIPVTAQIDYGDDADQEEDDERRQPSRPRRGERRPGRAENPKAKSKMLPIVLAFLGLGLFSCIGMAAALLVWLIAKEEPAPPPPDRFGQRPRAGGKAGFKKAGPGNANDPLLRLNLTPAAEIKLGADGFVQINSELALQDEVNPDQLRHKHYAIQLEQGKRYQIDMKVPKNVVFQGMLMKQFDAYLILVDDANKIVAENDDIEPPNGPNPHNQDSQIIFTAPRTATYKIEATFCNNGNGLELGEFILTVKRLPN